MTRREALNRWSETVIELFILSEQESGRDGRVRYAHEHAWIQARREAIFSEQKTLKQVLDV
jgi:hypothetical protein